MSWVLEGKTVKGNYLGQSVYGVVTNSRVKYGGKVSHSVKLNHPIKVFGDVRESVLLDQNEIVKVYTK